MNLAKLKIIIAREFMSRAKTKAFLLSTILTPLFIVAVTVVPILITAWDGDDEKVNVYAVVDDSGIFADRLIQNYPERYFNANDMILDSLKKDVMAENIAGIVVLNQAVYDGDVEPEVIYTTGGISVLGDVRREINKVWVDAHLEAENLSPHLQELIRKRIELKTSKLTETGTTKEENQFAAFGLAYVMAFTIYMALFGYGAIIMRSVLEEKTSRIVEVIISSVKPIELMMGKVLGVGMLGLVQLVFWMVLYSGITIIAAPLYLLILGKSGGAMMTQMPAEAPQMPFVLPELEISYIVLFLVYYLLGYIMYSSLFAAVGSAADAESDVQQFMFPIMIFIIIPMILLSKVATDPNSTFAIITSLVPLFSPILMVTRLGVTAVPWWEVGLSIVLMVGMIFLLLWIAARIYRVGILMYGKKPSYKELAKWIMYK
ncbi:ABC transporter permease [bacterium]|nr:MAG: ABC transporter permease [bacterium]